jgi:hypothetical protein
VTETVTGRGRTMRIDKGERNRNRVEDRDSDRKEDSKCYRGEEAVEMLIERMTVGTTR